MGQAEGAMMNPYFGTTLSKRNVMKMCFWHFPVPFDE